MGDRGAGSSSSSSSVKQYVQRIRQGDRTKWDKDELLNIVYWWRQVAGVLLGLCMGFAKVTGFMGFSMFFLSSISLTLAILKTVLGVDEEEYGGLTEFAFEGMMGSFASFMVTWILTYSAFQ